MIESLGLFWANVSAVGLIVLVFIAAWRMTLWGERKRREAREKWDAEHPPHLTHEQLKALIELADERIGVGLCKNCGVSLKPNATLGVCSEQCWRILSRIGT